MAEQFYSEDIDLSQFEQELGPLPFPSGPIDLNLSDFGAISIADVDQETGAADFIREATASSKTPEDKLATIQMYYPDAEPWGDGNYMFTSPETGKRTTFNPSGLDWGDIREHSRAVFEYIGGAAGATAAVVAGSAGPQIALPEEALTVPIAAGAGTAAGGQVYDALSDVLTPHVDKRTYLEKISNVGTDALSGMIGHKAGEVLQKWGRQGINKATSFLRAQDDSVYQAFRRMDVEPTAGAIGSKTIQGIEHGLSKLPLSAEKIGANHTRFLTDMTDYYKGIMEGVSPVVTQESAGKAILEGSKQFTKEFLDRSKVLYKEVDKYIAPQTRVELPNLGKTLSSIFGRKSDESVEAILGSNLANKFRRVHEASGKQVLDPIRMIQRSKGITYNELKKLRSSVGEKIKDKLLVRDTPQKQLSSLYAALSDDMMLAASKIKGLAKPGEKTKAMRAAERASAFYKAGMGRIGILNQITNKSVDEQVFRAAMSGSKEGASKIRALMKSLPPFDRDAMISQQVRQMGIDLNGQFNPLMFARRYGALNKESAETAKVLFGGERSRALASALEDLNLVSKSIKETGAMANPSGTAAQNLYMGALTGGSLVAGAKDPSGIIGKAVTATGIPWLSAKLITSPKFVRWLADGVRAPLTPNGIGAHLGKLAAIAEKNSDLRPAIYEYLDSLQSQPQAQGAQTNVQ